MQVVQRRSSKSNKSLAALMAAAVAGLGLFPAHANANDLAWSNTPTAPYQWSLASNWNLGVAPVNGDTLSFGLTTAAGYNPINNLTPNTIFAALSFNPDATQSYTLSGNAIDLQGDIADNSGRTHNINLDIRLRSNANIFVPSNMVINGSISSVGALGLIKQDGGTLTLAGFNTYTGATVVAGGAVNLTGRITGTLQVGNTAGQTGAFYLNGGTVNSTADVTMGVGSGNDSSGFIRVNSGIFATSGGITIGAASTVAAPHRSGMSVHGGTVSANSWVVVGSNEASSTLLQTGGVFNITNRLLTVGAGNAGSTGSATFTGGTLNVTTGDGGNGSMRIGEFGSGIVTVSGSAIINTVSAIRVAEPGNANLYGILNLNGGTLTTTQITKGNGTAGTGNNATLNLNGGVLRALTNGILINNFVNTTNGVGGAYVRQGGAIIDDNGLAVSVNSALLAPVGNGLAMGSLSASGGGYIEAPIVVITGGGGQGASAIANINANGDLTGITITSPGTGYTAAPTIEIRGGGGFGGISGTPDLVATASGGLTKLGQGTLTLATGNTYTGPTTIAGTLVVSGNAPIAATSALTLNGATLRYNGTTGDNAQTFAGTTLNRGANGIALSATGPTNNVALALGTITRAGGAGTLLNITLPATGSVTGTIANSNPAGGQNTIIGGWATVNGNTWATSNGTNITGLAAYEPGFVAGKDVDAPAGTSTPGAMTINSLRFNQPGAATVDTAGNLVIANGGILVTSAVGNNPVAINNNTLSAGGTGELNLHQYNTSNSLTIASQVSGSSLNVVGPGKVILSSATNALTGPTAVYGGTLNIAGDASIGSGSLTLQGATLQLGGSFNSNRAIVLNGSNATIDTNGFNSTQTGSISGPANLTKTGAGVLNLAGNNSFTGGLSVAGGTLDISGALTSLSTLAQINVGTAAGVPATLRITGGTLTANKPTAPSFSVAGTAGTIGIVEVTGGVLTTATSLDIGRGAGTFGSMSVSGGSVTAGSWFVVAAGNDRATFNQTGGVVTIANNFMTVGAGNAGSAGIANFSGGTYTANANNGGLYIGENGYGVANISGSAQIILGQNGLRAGVANNSHGIINLSGGTVTTNRVQLVNNAATTFGILNFHGGTLRASTNTTQFITNSGALATNNATTYIWGEGATLDDGGFNVTIPSALANPDGQGVTTIPVANAGSGYLTAPVVQILGGGGKGATAVATLSGGSITGFTITNPGVGYTAAPTISILGGAGTGATAGVASLNLNAAPGTLNKTGTGTLTLTSTVSTFTGPTNVAQGTFRLSGNTWNSAVTVASGAALAGAGNTVATITQPVIVAGGGSINLIDNAPGTLTLTNGLTIASGSPSTLKFDLGGNLTPTIGNDLLDLGTAAFDPGTGVVISLNNLGLVRTGSTYTLMSYGSNTNPGLVSLDPGSAKLGFDNVQLLVDQGFVKVTITGSSIPANAWWSGEHSALWSTISAGNESNFNAAQTGDVNTQKFPSLETNVFFATTSPAAQNLNTTLGGNFGVNSLTVKAGLPSIVTIAGQAGEVLSINGGGITVESGSNGLEISAGVRLNAAQTWNNQSAVPLAVNGVVSGTGGALTTTGLITLNGANTYTTGTTVSSGTLVLGNATALGTGALNVAGGAKVQINGVTAVTRGLSGTGTIEAAGTAAGTIQVNGSGSSSTFLGTIQNHELGGAAGLILNGGTLQLGSAATPATVNITGALTVRDGTLFLHSGNFTALGAPTLVADTTARARLIVGDGTSTPSITTRNVRQSFQVTTVNAAIGDVRMNSGTFTTSGPTGEFFLGGGSGNAYASMTMVGGTVNSGSYFVVGFNGDRAILNMTGGNINVNTNLMTIAAGGAAAFGVVNISGGTINAPANGIYVGENGNGILEISGNASVIATGQGTQVGTLAGSNGILNLRGGTLSTTRLFGGAGTSTANFNGGRLVNNNGTGILMNNLRNAYVWAGGIHLDSNGGNGAVNQNLLAPTGNGLGGTLAVTGYTGAINTPLVQITGGGGTGATGIATINEATGAVTGVVITNPGVGYTAAPTITLVGGGVSAGTITGAALTPNANTGGLTKYSSGTITLGGSANTYGGATTILGGALALSGVANINNTPSITVNGPDARFIHNSSVAVTTPVTVTSGAVDGTGTINVVNVANAPSNTVANGAGGVLTIGTLTFAGAGTIDARVNGASGINVTGTLTTGGQITVNPTHTGIWAIGLNNLVSFGTLAGNLSNFTLGTPSGTLTSRQSYGGLVLNGNALAIQINGDMPRWTGLDNGNWMVGSTGPNANWRLLTGNTPTDFLENDSVLFDDSAAGVTTIDISNGNVNPSLATFNNDTRAYTLTSAGGFGIATGAVIKNGPGTLTITNANTYSAGTTLNAGQLNLNNAAAIGSGTLTIAGGRLDTTAGPLTLSNNNAQNWTGDFTFVGSNNLDMGTGNVTVSGTGSPAANIAAGVLTVGEMRSTTAGFTKLGAGKLVVTSVGTGGGGSVIAGTLNVAEGTLQINRDGADSASSGDFTAGALTGNGTITNGASVIRWFFVNGTSSGLFSGVLANGPATLGLNKSGTGTLTLGGVNPYADVTTVSDGLLTFSGAGSALSSVRFDISNNGVLHVNGNNRIGSVQINITSTGPAIGTANRLELSGDVTLSNPIALAQRNNAASSTTATDAIRSVSGNNVLSGPITIGAGGDQARIQSDAGTLTLTGAITVLNTVATTRNLYLQGAGDGVLAGVLSDNSSNAAGNITLNKQGAGTWTLTGDNTYTGATTVSGGTLRVGNGGTTGQLGTGAITNSAGNLAFNRSDAIAITGAISGAGTLTQMGTGTTTLTGASAITGPTNVTAGRLVFGGGVSHSVARASGTAVTVAAGTTVTSDGMTLNNLQVNGTQIVRSNGSAQGASKVDTLSIAGATSAWTGKLDLTNNALVIGAADPAAQAAVLSTVANQVTSGRASGTWTGNGITSSSIPGMNTNASANAYTLAVADAGDLSMTTYRGLTGLDANSTVVVLARLGDATLDGQVNAFDLNILAANWQTSGKIWSTGDFTGDGTVDAFDLNALAANWQFGTGGSLQAALAQVGLGGAAAAVPEPASLAVLALGGAALLGRRRRKI